MQTKLDDEAKQRGLSCMKNLSPENRSEWKKYNVKQVFDEMHPQFCLILQTFVAKWCFTDNNKYCVVHDAVVHDAQVHTYTANTNIVLFLTFLRNLYLNAN